MPKKQDDKTQGHYDDLTDGKAGAEGVDEESKAEAAHEPAPEPEVPQHRIEDLLKDKHFDPEGKVRRRLAQLSIEGHEYAPADLVAQGR